MERNKIPCQQNEITRKHRQCPRLPSLGRKLKVETLLWFFISKTLPMTEPTPSSDLCFSDLSSELDNLPAPSMDPLFFSDNNHAMPSEAFASDLDLAMEFGNDGDFEISFDDLDNLYIPLEVDDFLIPNDSVQSPALHDADLNVDDKQLSYNSTHFESPDSDTSGSGNQISNVSQFLNSQSPESGSCHRELSVAHSADTSGDQDSHHSLDGKVSSFKLPDSDSCDRESSGGPVSSHGSGNGIVMNSPTLSSDCDDRDISSLGIAGQNRRLGEMGKIYDLKRKKQHNEGNTEARTTKFRKSSMPMDNTSQQSDLSALDEEDDKRKARLLRNRESAQLSRQRKKHYVEELEEKVRSMHSTITDLSSKVSVIMAENATLRQQLSATGMCLPPAPGMYPHPPMAPMPYPWMPYAPYAVKPQGSQVPLVPIPRLKSQQSQSAPKAKKSENKKPEGRTKKVASISFLGLFFFIFLFGGLVPLVNYNFGDLGDNIPGRSISIADRFYSQRGGKVWEIIGYRNGSEGDRTVGFSSRNLSISDRLIYEKGRKLEETYKQRDSPCRTGSDGSVHKGNASEPEPLLASLYVPRNDKLVKIDGNLIIHSVLATEKAKASQTVHSENNRRETGLAISKDWDSALAIPEVGRNRDSHPHLYRSPPEQRKALASGSAETLKDHLKSTATDGKMQKWFHEGLAGPMLSSGMCSEVFQFDASPTPGAIVPASPVANVSAVNPQNDTSINKSRNRRFLDRPPSSLARSDRNPSKEHGRNSQNEDLTGNKSMSSMVVSVLVDPKEVGDGDVDGMMQHKSLSRIFVVVLIDSVKHVTYSCGLPRTPLHLVTA
ncbi:bZIP transcription factor 17 [Neltuma alba]|uniref:bZIP transcription factor 17 n=1 Tax=Neltuma alba TaxID=207710 RepID=UPI0010A557DB|nr:bZIP transcription factor 17-like [Prosopis alba]